MRKLLALSCALAAACGGSAAFKDQARDAMPNSSGVAVGPQQAQSSQSNALSAEGSSRDVIGADPWYNATVQGTIDITYSNVGPAHIQANFHNLISQDTQHLGDLGNAYYNYQQDISCGGDMEIAWHDVTHEERDDIHSRWKADGSGRADVMVVKPGVNLQISNCWSAAASGFATVFSPTSGSVSACSYLDAAFGANINTPL